MQFVWYIPAFTTTKDERRKTCRDFVPTKNQYVATVMQDHIVGCHIYMGVVVLVPLRYASIMTAQTSKHKPLTFKLFF